MIRYQVAGRYAMALFKAPCANEMLERRLLNLEAIEKYIDQNPKFSLYLYAPEITQEEKEAFVKKILNLDSAVQGNKVMQDFELESLSMGVDHSQKVKATPIESDYSSKDGVNLLPSTAESRLNENVDPVLLKFLFFLIKRKRLEGIDEINMKYRQLVSQFLGILNVNVVSATPLDQSEKEALKIKIEQVYPNKKIAFIEKIDPNIIGGLIVVIDHRIIDLSVKNTLTQMKEQLLAAPV